MPRKRLPVFEIFRHEADDTGLKAKAGEVAEDDDSYPYENEDAIFELAHPAGEDRLRNQSNCSADDADGKCDQ
jgi:hypothetical protein